MSCVLIPFYEQIVRNLVPGAEALQCLSVWNALGLVADVEPLVIGLPLCLAKNSSLEYVILAVFGLSRKVQHSRHSPQYVIFTRLLLYFAILHGFPYALAPSGMSWIITEPAPIVHHLPILIPGMIVVPAPIQEPSPILTFPHNVA